MATLSLNIDARGATTGANQFQTATNKIKTSASQAATATQSAGSALQRMGNMSGAQRFVFQNTANQLGDIAVQASMGTNMFRVLGMQLPQVAGGFAILGGTLGTVAPILGVIAAVGFPLIAVFTQLGSGAKSFGDQVDSLSDSLDAVKDGLDLVQQSTKDLAERYGDATLEVRQFALAQAQLAAGEAQRKVLGLVDSLVKLSRAYTNSAGRAREVNRAVRQLGEDFDLSSKDQIPRLQQAFNDLGAAMREPDKDLTNLRTSSINLLNTLDELGINLQETEDEALIGFATALTNMGIEAARAEQILKELSAAQDVLRITITEGTTDVKLAGKELSLYQERLASLARVQMLMRQAPMFINMHDLDAAANLFNKLKKEQEDAAKATGKLSNQNKKLFESLSKISPEQQKVIDLSERIGTSFENALMSASKGTLSVRDAFRAMATDIIGELYRVFVVKQITGFVTQSIQGLFGVSQLDQGISLRPQARPITGVSAFGGPVTPSRGVVVGERGPEVFFPNTKGTIASNNELGGSNVVVNQSINVTTGVQQTVRAEILGLMPQIQEASKAAVLDAKRRGGSFAGAF